MEKFEPKNNVVMVDHAPEKVNFWILHIVQ